MSDQNPDRHPNHSFSRYISYINRIPSLFTADFLTCKYDKTLPYLISRLLFALISDKFFLFFYFSVSTPSVPDPFQGIQQPPATGSGIYRFRYQGKLFISNNFIMEG